LVLLGRPSSRRTCQVNWVTLSILTRFTLILGFILGCWVTMLTWQAWLYLITLMNSFLRQHIGNWLVMINSKRSGENSVHHTIHTGTRYYDCYSAFFSSLFLMLFFPYRTKFTTNLNKFVKRGQNWKKLTKMKKENIIGGSFKIHLKCPLWFSNFIKYNFSIPQYFKNSIMVQNFTVLFFSLWFERR
jgi:hypothetical protein